MILLDPLARPVIGHRGFRANSPENTLLAFERAITAGADALELDVHVTADGHVVVCHDPTLDRTTNGSGAIAEMRFAVIRELDAGSGQHVPLLSEILEAFAATPLIIDLKVEAAGHLVPALVARHSARERVLLGAFRHEALLPARDAGFHTGASQSELAWMLPAAIVRRRARGVAFDAIAMPPDYLGIPLPVAGFVKSARVPLHVWTVNAPRVARSLWRRGASGIITDDPAVMLAERARAAPR